jgi:hypothetical protein
MTYKRATPEKEEGMSGVQVISVVKQSILFQ